VKRGILTCASLPSKPIVARFLRSPVDFASTVASAPPHPRRWHLILTFVLLCTPAVGWAQWISGLPQDPAAGKSGSSGIPPEEDRSVSWRQLAPNILHDQLPILTFPGKGAEGKHWKPAVALIGLTAGMVALDPIDTPYFRRTATFNQFNRVFSGTNMALGTALVPASFYAVSLVRRNTFGQHTSLLAGEAVVDAEILTAVMKNVDRRLRPSGISPYGDYDDTWFRTHGSLTGGQASFPSGHAIAAFAVATVFANRYRHHRWAPWVAYGLAGLVGFSRITLSAHFPSDVVAGAALGYVISRYVVLGNP